MGKEINNISEPYASWDEALRDFCTTTDDCLRSILQNPNRINNFIYSSDGNCLLKIDGALSSEKYESPENNPVPDFERVINQAIENKLPSPIKLFHHKIADALAKCHQRSVFKEEECDICDGFGRFFDGNDMEWECPKCNSSGKMDIKIVDHIEYDADNFLIGFDFIDDYFFNPNFINRVYRLRNLASEFEIVAGADKNSLMITGNLITILISPIIHTNQKIIKIEV